MKKYLMMVRFSASGEWVVHQSYVSLPECINGMVETLKFGHGGTEAMFVEVLDPVVTLRGRIEL